jgi:acetyl/propionyl-CoA carboxylase alpha subunit
MPLEMTYSSKYLRNPRHIEFQIRAIRWRHHACLQRECSIQRKYQKVIEKRCLRTDADVRVWVRLLLRRRAANYQCGTVEFVLDPDGGFYFLEMNARLQVDMRSQK